MWSGGCGYVQSLRGGGGGGGGARDSGRRMYCKGRRVEGEEEDGGVEGEEEDGGVEGEEEDGGVEGTISFKGWEGVLLGRLRFLLYYMYG